MMTKSNVGTVYTATCSLSVNLALSVVCVLQVFNVIDTLLMTAVTIIISPAYVHVCTLCSFVFETVNAELSLTIQTVTRPY